MKLFHKCPCDRVNEVQYEVDSVRHYLEGKIKALEVELEAKMEELKGRKAEADTVFLDLCGELEAKAGKLVEVEPERWGFAGYSGKISVETELPLSSIRSLCEKFPSLIHQFEKKDGITTVYTSRRRKTA